MDPRVEARRHQAGEHTRDRGTRLTLGAQRMLPLPNEEFQRALHQVLIERSAFEC